MSEKIFCPYCFWDEPEHHPSCPSAEIASLRTQLAAAEEELAWEMNARMDAEERADRAEKRSQFNKDNHLAAEQEIERLTAELSTLRRTSVRVDVLDARIERQVKHCMEWTGLEEYEVRELVARDLCDLIQYLAARTRRSLRKENGHEETHVSG